MEKQYDDKEKLPFYQFIDARGGTWTNYVPAFGCTEIVRRLSESRIRLPLWVRISEDKHGNAILAARDFGRTVAADGTSAEICNWLADASAARQTAKGAR